MPGFSLTKMAKADLVEIGRYTQKRWGREQRDQYLKMLDVSFQQLVANPLKGNDCSDIRAGYRKFAVGSHVIFYRQTFTGTVEVVRVLRGRVDLETRLTEPFSTPL